MAAWPVSLALLSHLPALCFLLKIQHAPFCLMLPGVNIGWLTRVPRIFSEWYTMWPTPRQCAFHSGKDNFTHACYVQNRYKPWSIHLSACYGSFALQLCVPPTLVAWIEFSMLDTSFGWVLANVMLASRMHWITRTTTHILAELVSSL